MNYSGGVVKKSLFLKFTEQLLTKGTSLVISVILARLLNVEDFGIVAILTVFTSLASAIIEGGLSTSLIQMKEVDEKDYSTVFLTSLLLAVLLYFILFISAPFVASYYGEEELCACLRVIGIMLFFTPFNATQLGYVYRHMMFGRLLISTTLASVISGLCAIVMAWFKFGVWALIAQNLIASFVGLIVLLILVPWRPKAYFSMQRLALHFSYGWKLLVSSLLDTLYNDIRSLIIGKRYSTTDLSYFNRGETYPKTVITSLNMAIQSVMLPTMSAQQDNLQEVKRLVRKSVSMSSFVLFPIMAIFAGTSENFVRIVLTEKWLPCVPFLQLSCFTYAIQPINSCNVQALKAIGRSDMILALTLIKNLLGCVMVFMAAFCFKTPMAIAVAAAIYAPIQLLVNTVPNSRIIKYTTLEQFKDIVLPAILSVITFVCVNYMNKLRIYVWVNILLQGIAGITVYTALSLLLNRSEVRWVADVIKIKKKD